MKTVRMLGIALVAAFMLCAAAAASASAAEAPTYKECVSQSGGAYTTGCKKAAKPGKGVAELVEVEEPETFTGTGKAAKITLGSKEVKCKHSSVEGVIQYGDGSAGAHYTFSECELGKAKCTTGSEAAGTIKTPRLDTQLQYLNPGETEVGISAGLVGGTFADFTCGTEAFEVKGEVGGTIKNEGAKGTTVTYKVKSGVQEHDALYDEGESFTVGLQSGAHETATLSVTFTDGPANVGAYGA
ncbi:MAG TPA: hypothetical protein VMB51_12085 [Solirubrobacteraceae bacterium]|nr:hypothetical protein [Solirubrobacteraceae bacterium]